MHPSKIRLLHLALLFFLVPTISSNAALRLEGNASYELLRSDGTRTFIVEESFSAVVESNKWLVSTERVTMTPASTQRVLFAPASQQAGSSGEDAYYLKNLSGTTNEQLVGWVEPGSVPNMAQSPTACLVWLAYCASFSLADSKPQQLKPIWVVQVNSNRQDKCAVQVEIHRGPENSAYPDQLRFLSDGRYDSCNPSRDPTNVWSAPWNEGFTQAIFQVETRIMAADGKKVPGVFTFELLTPVSHPSPRMRVLSRMHGTITNTAIVQIPSWLPSVPGHRNVGVDDYRFTDKITNWDSVAYRLTSQWNSRTDTVVAAALRMHQQTSPSVPPPTLRVREVRYLVLAGVLFPLFVIAWQYLKKRKTKGEKT